MRRFLQKLFLRPVLWATKRFSSSPQREKIVAALDKLYKDIQTQESKKGLLVPFTQTSGKFIIFSDQHKGAGDGADDFAEAAPNYLAALEYYNSKEFFYICLGDSEELWENTLGKVKEQYSNTFEAEKKFARRDAFIKIFGNHDLYWDNDPFASFQLKKIYEQEIKIYEGVVLATEIGEKQLRIFCTHGHQGDAQSDGNWFSKFFVARIWGPFQSYLRINPNTPAYNNEKKTLHNEIMYEWSSRQADTLLVTGHTHQPVFESLTQIERLYRRLQGARSTENKEESVALEAEIRKIEIDFSAIAIDYLTMRPSYFNSGCCCFSDGDITGIEIADSCIRLIKWTKVGELSQRVILEEISLKELVGLL
jgi:predicted phosphodiesterase